MYDTIIIGAGFAGLSAARRLMQLGQDNVLVLEARDRVGGRTKHGTLAGLDIDLGGMWLGPTQTRLAALAEEFGVATYPTFLDGKGVFRLGGREHLGNREDFAGLFGLRDGVSYWRLNRALTRLVESVDCEAPWAHPDASRLDAMTVEQWLEDNCRSEQLKRLIRFLCISLFCAEANQISLLFFLHYVRSGGDLDTLISAESGGGQNLLFQGGVQQLARQLADNLGDRLKLNEPVRTIRWEDNGVTVGAVSGEHQGRRVIIAVPPTLVPGIEFTPALPTAKNALHARLAMGSVVKYWVAYETPFWRDLGLNGMVVRDDSPCTPCFDVSPPDQPLGLIAGFFEGDHSLQHGDDSESQRQHIVTTMLAEHFGEQALKPVDYIDTNWTAETWSGGCYGAYAAPGIYSRYGQWLKQPIGPLIWAGTETSPVWTGYIEGAICSGERAAAEAIR